MTANNSPAPQPQNEEQQPKELPNTRQELKKVQASVEQGIGLDTVKDFFSKIFEVSGISALLEYLSSLFGFSVSKKRMEKEPEEVAREFALSQVDVVPTGGKNMYAKESFPVCSVSHQTCPVGQKASGNQVLPGQEVVLISSAPDDNGMYKIKALGKEELYITQASFEKLQDTRPSVTGKAGRDTYVMGDSIAQGVRAQAAHGGPFPGQGMKPIVHALMGRVHNNKVQQRHIALVMGFNDLNITGTTLATLQQKYDHVFSQLSILVKNYDKKVSLAGLFTWQGGQNNGLVAQINAYIQQRCGQYGIQYVDITAAKDSTKGLHNVDYNKISSQMLK